MYELADKGFLILSCLALGLTYRADPALVTPFIVSLIMSAANTYRIHPWLKGCSLCLLLLLSMLEPTFLLFSPLCLYDVFFTPQAWFTLLMIPALIAAYPTIGLSMTALLLLFSGVSFMIKDRTLRHIRLLDTHNKLRDSAAELALRLESTNRELRLHQDEQVQSARLQERNRIAREIHDNVGHLLSSAMLQVGALMTLPQVQSIREPLNTLKGTLSEGMTNVRQSVHGLFDESVDLKEELSSIVKGFTFCHAVLDYDVETSPGRQIKFAFLAVVKEALSNIIRHSNATEVSITVREHPALYQLDIRDNGKGAIQSVYKTGGIGLTNMSSRIADLNGRFLVTQEKGFHIFISVPKEGTL